MKRSRICSRVLLIAVLAALAAAGSLKAQQQGPPKGKLPFRAQQNGKVNFQDLLELTKQAPAKDRITDAELQVIKNRHKIKYGPGFKPVKEGGQTKPARGDYYKNSTLLTDGTNHTVLPKSALISLPEKYQDRKIEEPLGDLVLFPDFLKKNTRWIRTQEVTLKTALGEEPLSEEKMEALRNSGAVIVGVLRGSPISVLPPKEPDNSLTETNSPGSATADTPRTSRYKNNNTQLRNTTLNRPRK